MHILIVLVYFMDIMENKDINKNNDNSNLQNFNSSEENKQEININMQTVENNKTVKKSTDKSISKKKKKSKNSFWKWPICVLFLTLLLSIIFSLSSEFILSGAGIVLSIFLLLIFISIACISDMIGVAVTAAEIEPFLAMNSKKIKSAKQALKLVKNAEKISSVCCDIVGDICGILSGTIGASIVTLIAVEGNIKNILVTCFVSAIIAALTVFLKAVGKRIAIKNANKVILTVAKVISLFKFGK